MALLPFRPLAMCTLHARLRFLEEGSERCSRNVCLPEEDGWGRELRKLGHEGVRGRCASMKMFLMLRPSKYVVALVGSKVCKYEHVPDPPSGLCMTWQVCIRRWFSLGGLWRNQCLRKMACQPSMSAWGRWRECRVFNLRLAAMFMPWRGAWVRWQECQPKILTYDATVTHRFLFYKNCCQGKDRL